ncbi:MAG: MATE family efflux transporter [Gemmatimonadales bacterium]
MPVSFRLPRAADLRVLLRLALPVVTAQVGMMAMGVVDTIMVGHLSTEALAAVALGNVYYFGATIFGMGTLLALDPVLSHAAGAGDREEIARGIQRGMVLAVLLCLPTAFLLWPAPAVFAALHQPLEVVPLAGAYVRVCAPGTIGVFAFIVLRQSLQALHRMRPVVLTILFANLLNIGLNWVFIYGHLGAPALGAVGSAWATTISRLLMAMLLLALAWPWLREDVRPFRRAALELAPLGRLLRIGIPIGLQHQLEYGVFGIVGLLTGTMGTNQVAGHQIALNLASLTFMVPLGISSAAAVVVGQAVGRRDQRGAIEAAQAALTVAVAFMGSTALIFLLVPGWLVRLYTTAPGVIAVTLSLLPLAAVFQVFDGIQVTSIGILRGLGDTRTPMITGILGYWAIGLPVSLWLGFYARLGPVGLWWGLVLGLALVAVFLLARVRRNLTYPLRRVTLEASVEPLPAADR